MNLNYAYRQYDDYYVGHLVDYPEYDTQGKTIGELETMLKSLYADLMSADNLSPDILTSMKCLQKVSSKNFLTSIVER